MNRAIINRGKFMTAMLKIAKLEKGNIYEEHNLRYSEERVFQDEVQRTLLLVFEADFQEYL